MKNSIILVPFCAIALSGCSISIDAGDWDDQHRNKSSLSIRTDENREAEVVCANGHEPYSTGGENGEPLVMGCRAPKGTPE